MMGPILNAMRLQAQRASAESVSSRIGKVTAFDPTYYAARVELQPDGIITGWLPVSAHWMGNGWGMFSPPSPGDMVSVVFIDSQLEGGYVEGRFWNDEDRPLPVPAGEFWLVHKSGAFFKLTNDGKGSFSDGHGASVTLNGDGTISSAGTWTHTGNLTVNGAGHITGNVQVDQTLTATTDVVGGGKSLKTHIHSGVTTGSGTSGPPV